MLSVNEPFALVPSLTASKRPQLDLRLLVQAKYATNIIVLLNTVYDLLLVGCSKHVSRTVS